LHKSNCIVLGCVDTSSINHLLLVDTPVRAGFPSPADDYLEAKLDLTEHLVKHPSATYILKQWVIQWWITVFLVVIY
jgi:DNA polymerase V